MNLNAPDAAIDTDLFGNALSELAIKRATGIQTFVDRGGLGYFLKDEPCTRCDNHPEGDSDENDNSILGVNISLEWFAKQIPWPPDHQLHNHIEQHMPYETQDATQALARNFNKGHVSPSSSRG